MARVLFIFVLLLLSVWIGVQLHNDPGYLLISINNWSVETTLWVAIGSVILLFILMHSFLLLISWITNIPRTFRNWRAARRAHKAQAKTRQGLIEFSEGHWAQAKNHLIKALPDTDTPLLNYLTAARAAQEMGDNKLRDDYLREAQQSMPEAKIAVELTQAQLQIANRQWEQALATLMHLQTLAPNHPYVLKLLMNLYEEIKDWPQLMALLPELKRKNILTDNGFLLLEQQTYLNAMADLIKLNQSETLKSLVESLPKHLKNDPELMAVYCEHLINSNDYIQAESTLRRCLQKQFDDKLITLYGQIKNEVVQLRFAESLLKQHAHSKALYLCLGRICQFNNLWGKARTYYEESIQLGASPFAYAELGKLLEQLHDQSAAFIAYKQGLLLANKMKQN